MGLRALFTDHPASVGETYGQHLRFAVAVGLRMLGGGVACVIHGVFPFLFTTTGSRTISHLYQCCTPGKSRRPFDPMPEQTAEQAKP